MKTYCLIIDDDNQKDYFEKNPDAPRQIDIQKFKEYINS